MALYRRHARPGQLTAKKRNGILNSALPWPLNLCRRIISRYKQHGRGTRIAVELCWWSSLDQPTPLFSPILCVIDWLQDEYATAAFFSFEIFLRGFLKKTVPPFLCNKKKKPKKPHE
jgi:hypothetical protein